MKQRKRFRSSFYFLKIIWEASPGRVLSCLGINILHHLYMDEPSSALDPVSEYNLNKLIMQVGERKSVILISHRLSSTRMADRIYVLDHGSIAEVGSHDELMRNNGLYAKMFQMQASEYRKNA